MYISLGFTMLLYVALAIGVFGTLTVEEVIANADTALAVAALPIFGAFGYTHDFDRRPVLHHWRDQLAALCFDWCHLHHG